MPVHLIQAGSGEGQVPLRKLPRTVQKLKPTLTKQETAEVIKRLTALGAVRLPCPRASTRCAPAPTARACAGR